MSTRVKVEEKDTKFIDYNLLGKEVKRLESAKRGLIADTNAEAKRLSDLVEKGIEAKEEAEKIVNEAKERAKVITANAKKKEAEANEKKTELQTAIAEAKEAKEQSDKLIKSNQGKEKNLSAEKKTVGELKTKLIEISNKIKEVI